MKTKEPMKSSHRRVLELFEKKDEKGILKMVREGSLAPDEWIPSTVPGDKFKLLPSAIRRDWAELAIFLIECGVDINEYSETSTPLMVACENRNHHLIEALLAAGADPNLKTRRARESNGWTALMVSAAQHDLWAVRRLLKAGADPKIVTPRKHTAVYFAAIPRTSEDTAKVIRALVAAGCPLLGYELHPPIYRGDAETTKLLIQLGCSPDAHLLYDEARGLKHGETPLTTAIGGSAFDLEAFGFTEDRTVEKRQKIARLLLAAGADPNLANARGYTPLLLAVMQQELGLAELLVKAGADPAYVPPKAKTGSPVSLAAKKKLDSFIRLFQGKSNKARPVKDK
jgi:hypothetical protein